MALEEILALAAGGESEALEFKRTTGTRRQAAATVCAMLNHRGGHVLFGVTPEGEVVGQQVSDRTIEEVSAEIQRIDPPAFPEIGRVRVAGELEVISVTVNHGSVRPYRHRGTAYRRVGNTTVTMSAEEYNRIALRADAQRAALGESARHRMDGRGPGCGGGPQHCGRSGANRPAE